MNTLEFKKDFTEKEKNQFAIQYTKLINKIVKQFFDKGMTDWSQLESAAWEGFAIAMKDYNPDRSKLNFTQYAGWSIRNRILSSIDEELRTVKVSFYNRKKAEETGGSIYSRISIDAGSRQSNDEDSANDSSKKFNLDGMHTNPTFSDGDTYEYIYYRLESNFPAEQCDMFYRSFGLNGYDEVQKGKDIARVHGISEGSVSQKVKKIITWMRSDVEICEMLSNLLQN